MEQQEPAPAGYGEQQPSLEDRIKLAIGVIAALALATFLLQNLQRAEIHFLWFEWTTRMIWALLVSAAFGAFSAFLVTIIRPRRRP